MAPPGPGPGTDVGAWGMGRAWGDESAGGGVVSAGGRTGSWAAAGTPETANASARARARSGWRTAPMLRGDRLSERDMAFSERQRGPGPGGSPPPSTR